MNDRVQRAAERMADLCEREAWTELEAHLERFFGFQALIARESARK